MVWLSDVKGGVSGSQFWPKGLPGIADGSTIRETVIALGHVERGDLTEEQLDEAPDVSRMTHP